MPKSCCAVNCHNHNMMKDRKISFFTFPKDNDRREKWINAVKRINPDGSAWRPSKETVLCADHFITGKPNLDCAHPDYIPSQFSHSRTNEKDGEKKLQRYASAAKRKISFATPIPAKKRTVEQHTPLSNENILQEMCTPDSESNIIGLKKPVELSEREMLHQELDQLRREKEILMEENRTLKEKIDIVMMGSSCIEGNDSKSKFYTGLSWSMFLTIFNFLTQFVKAKPLDKKISRRDQFFLTLLKLRLDLPFEFMSYHTGISCTSVSDVFWTWMDIMYVKLDFLIKWPDRESIGKTLPGVFKKKFPKLTCIVDCFEIFIERPRNLKARGKCYSNYKKHSTVKFFIGCTPLGSVSFLSRAWGGRVSDIEIVRKSGFIDHKYHLPGDQILADRGFTLQDDFACVCGAELIIPAFTKGKKQLSAKDVEISRKISSVRIHIERIIGLMKHRFIILQGTLPITFIKSLNDEADELDIARVDKLVRVCGILVNLGDGIVYSEK